MSRNKVQHLVYAFVTVVITVHAFVFYSLYVVEGEGMMRATGTTSVLQAINSQGGIYMFGNYLPIWLVIVVEIVCAFVLVVAMGGPLAFRLASRKFAPNCNHPVLFESAIVTATVCLMCPSMSLLADFFYYPYYEGFDVIDFLCRWFRLICHNLPFAYFSQMFFVQPFVRFVVGKIFADTITLQSEQKTMVNRD